MRCLHSTIILSRGGVANVWKSILLLSAECLPRDVWITTPHFMCALALSINSDSGAKCHACAQLWSIKLISARTREPHAAVHNSSTAPNANSNAGALSCSMAARVCNLPSRPKLDENQWWFSSFWRCLEPLLWVKWMSVRVESRKDHIWRGILFLLLTAKALFSSMPPNYWSALS